MATGIRVIALAASVSALAFGAFAQGTAQIAAQGAMSPVSGVELSGFTQAIAEAAASDPALAGFYAARDYRPIWTSQDDQARRAALFSALDRSGEQGLPQGHYDPDGLRARFAAVQSERQRGLLEVETSKVFLEYAHDVSHGVLDPNRVLSEIKREPMRADPQLRLTAFAASGNPALFLRELAPQMPQYAQLLKDKLDLQAQIAEGGWGDKLPAGKLQPGEQGPAVIALRNRLQKMGYLGRSATARFDGDIQKAVQSYQADQGLTPDGVVGESTREALNTSPEDRMKSVLVALERLRWMNGIDFSGRYIWVNIPDFSVRVVDNGKTTFRSVTVVGQSSADRQTPEFSDEMERMVINPSWHVPRSIVTKEYLPQMQRNPNAAGQLQLIDSRGQVVPRSAVNFAAYNARNFPFAMKQPPSTRNALGLVKFLFPNKWNIYLHDTPSKSLFNKESRAFSHGCVRVGKPFDLAYVLLGAQSPDPKAEFQRILNTGRETVVPLKQPVPVHLVYFTAYPTPTGHVEYRRDVYGRDGRIFEALARAGVELPGSKG
ncbi:peptidoglycan-binding protein [Thioclava dalianensis]|uniref:Peptidoglycan-binding protein n=1 Tax=Thioclava dalianensis TaxID=1185766 RepID=A0A074U5Z9_9RHOB|nr:L,D-transpeptidase family protein [Thioclava dalianensis]KEP70077.1 peptidoglycan-binding protein [Thioclava dalianensis]SFN51851.1 Murein L,D-transpeptidase YcbB/YkuD [Thioclava dalianensis]